MNCSTANSTGDDDRTLRFVRWAIDALKVRGDTHKGNLWASINQGLDRQDSLIFKNYILLVSVASDLPQIKTWVKRYSAIDPS